MHQLEMNPSACQVSYDDNKKTGPRKGSGFLFWITFLRLQSSLPLRSTVLLVFCGPAALLESM